VRGAYSLLIGCERLQLIKIGKLGKVKFGEGKYLYVGSALNGIERRVSRHLRKSKKVFWHIDYLLASNYVNVECIYYLETSKKLECLLSKELQKFAISVRGFGCSGCDCTSHLFYVPERSIPRVNNLLLRQHNFEVLKTCEFLDTFDSCLRFTFRIW